MLIVANPRAIAITLARSVLARGFYLDIPRRPHLHRTWGPSQRLHRCGETLVRHCSCSEQKGKQRCTKGHTACHHLKRLVRTREHAREGAGHSESQIDQDICALDAACRSCQPMRALVSRWLGKRHQSTNRVPLAMLMDSGCAMDSRIYFRDETPTQGNDCEHQQNSRNPYHAFCSTSSEGSESKRGDCPTLNPAQQQGPYNRSKQSAGNQKETRPEPRTDGCSFTKISTRPH